MGHPARLLPQVLEHSMEALVSRHEGTAIVKDVRKEIDKLLVQLYGEPGTDGAAGYGSNSKSRARVRGADRKGARQEVKVLRKEARAREGKVVREVLRSRDVVLATCVGAATYSLREEEFDLVVIDEAAQVRQLGRRTAFLFSSDKPNLTVPVRRLLCISILLSFFAAGCGRGDAEFFFSACTGYCTTAAPPPPLTLFFSSVEAVLKGCLSKQTPSRNYLYMMDGSRLLHLSVVGFDLFGRRRLWWQHVLR
ncbi:unnamed protein product [Pylaiella littoralis]